VDARELVEQAYERRRRTGELPADLMHPDVALHNAMSTGEPAYRGPEGWRQWQEDLDDVWDDQLDAQLITFRDGLAVRMDYYPNYRADAPPWD
jgi:hypothetical protein